MQLRNDPFMVELNETTNEVTLSYYDVGYATSPEAMGFTPTKVIRVTVPAVVEDYVPPTP